MLKTIIIDDELKSRESLEILIKDFCQNVTVMALCANISEGIEAINKHEPDIVFLDIQLQRETGFDLFSKLSEVKFEVVFTTAYSEYAIKAFKYSAIDYLLKPIDIAELTHAIGRVEKKRTAGDMDLRLQNLMHHLSKATKTKLALPTTEGLSFVEIPQVIYCEASSNYTVIHTVNGEKHLVSRTLKEYEQLLAEHNFFRIHNSFLINMEYIKKYVRGEGGYVVMSNDVSLDVSKRKKELFLEKLGV